MRKNKAPWKVLDEHYYEKFRIFQIKRSRRLNPRTGKPFDFFLMEGLDWVNVIPLTSDNQIVLVRQIRHGINEFTLEIPGGCVEAGEDPLISAARELKEETGFSSEKFEFLGQLHPNPAMQSMRCFCYIARNCEKVSKQELDHGEDIEVLCLPFSEVIELIKSGGLTHSIVLSAFTLLFARYPELLSCQTL